MVKSFRLKVLGVNLDLKTLCISVTIFNSEIPQSPRYVLMHILVTAKITYAQFWKSPFIPAEDLLKQNLKTCIEMDRLTLTLHQESNQVFKLKWSELYKLLGMDLKTHYLEYK